MPKSTSDQPQKTDVEARVDAMMDVNADGVVDPSPSSQPIDIFAGQSSPVDAVPGAPVLPGAKHHKVAAVQEQPVEQPVSKQQLKQPIEPEGDDISVPDRELDTPQTDKAIADIVAQEADEVLAAQDAGIERAIEAAEDAAPEPVKKSGHPIFWFFVTLLVVIAAAAAYVLTSPGLDLPFGL